MSDSQKTLLGLKKENAVFRARVRSLRTIQKQKMAIQRKNECSEKRFKTIFEQSTFGNKIINDDLNIVKVNKSLVKILGYNKKELVGRTVLEFTHPDFVANWDKLRDELWSSSSARRSFSIDTCLIRKNKSVVWCHVTSILFDDDGDRLGFTIVEDITDRKQSERLKLDLVRQENLLQIKSQEHKQQKKLFETFVKAQEEERERIAEGLHNGLGQLLYAVKLKLSLVKPDSKDPDRIQSALTEANKLLSETISECRRTAHHLLPRILNDFGLKAGIQELGRTLPTSISFEFEYESQSPIREKYYEVVIYRAVQELLLNIMKHAEATKAVCLVKIDSKVISVEVKDNGKGFKPEVKQKMGIGLSALKSRILQMEGTFEVASQPKKGAVVRILLPRRKL